MILNYTPAAVQEEARQSRTLGCHQIRPPRGYSENLASFDYCLLSIVDRHRKYDHHLRALPEPTVRCSQAVAYIRRPKAKFTSLQCRSIRFQLHLKLTSRKTNGRAKNISNDHPHSTYTRPFATSPRTAGDPRRDATLTGTHCGGERRRRTRATTTCQRGRWQVIDHQRHEEFYTTWGCQRTTPAIASQPYVVTTERRRHRC